MKRAARDRHTMALGEPQMAADSAHHILCSTVSSERLTPTVGLFWGCEYVLNAFADVQMRQLRRVSHPWSLLDLRRLHDAASRHGL